MFVLTDRDDEAFAPGQYGICTYVLIIISTLLVMITFPFSLIVCLKVSSIFWHILYQHDNLNISSMLNSFQSDRTELFGYAMQRHVFEHMRRAEAQISLSRAFNNC